MTKDVSYALGLGIGHQLAQMDAKDLSVEDFAAAIKDVLEGKELRMSNREAQRIVEVFFKVETGIGGGDHLAQHTEHSDGQVQTTVTAWHRDTP